LTQELHKIRQEVQRYGCVLFDYVPIKTFVYAQRNEIAKERAELFQERFALREARQKLEAEVWTFHLKEMIRAVVKDSCVLLANCCRRDQKGAHAANFIDA